MRITFVVPSIRCGGAERILTAMANYWAANGRTVTILTFDSESVTPFYPLSPEVRLQSLDVLSEASNFVAGFRNNLQRIWALRGALQATCPDVIISFLIRTNVRVLLASLGFNTPIIISERSDPFLSQPGKLWQGLARITYPFASKITVFTAHAAKYFPASLRNKIRVIPNPVLALDKSAKLQAEGYRIVAVGRLEHVKGFDLLLKSFALVQQIFPTASLTIWGEGSQRRALEALRDELSLSAHVSFPGVTKDVVQALTEADLFVQTSRWEGFGNALCEAMSVGLPVISTCCSGPQEIIRDGVDGVLVPVENVDALADAILNLLPDFSKRQSLAANALEITKRFALRNIMRQWEQLLTEITD
ncbi:MAG: glycosyltransferase family 4 protein [Acidobacteria bacterium]|nr:glycosyltransferase family 4 protein [Acidobacteriota bacterium]